MFNDSKYTKWYFSLIESRRNLSRDCFLEKHHIVPKCLGGGNNAANIAMLTPREHYICHMLLLHMVDEPNLKKKMAYAFIRMGQSNAKDKNQKRVTARQFERIRKSCSDYFKGEKNPFYGKGHFGKDNPMSKPENYERFLNAVRSPQNRQRMAESHRGEGNPFYGKRHTDEARAEISKKRQQPISVLLDTGNIVQFQQYGELGRYLGKSTYLGSKLCSGNYNHLWKNYGIKEIIRHDKDSEKRSED